MPTWQGYVGHRLRKLRDQGLQPYVTRLPASVTRSLWHTFHTFTLMPICRWACHETTDGSSKNIAL
jgi:hypothetical protein